MKILIALFLLLAAPLLAARRPPKKDGLDPLACEVAAQSPIDTSIEEIHSWPSARRLGRSEARRAPWEATVWRVRGDLVLVKTEADGDLHMVLRDADGRTMIVEAADPDLQPDGAPLVAEIAAAWDAVKLAIGGRKSARLSGLPVIVEGPGFVDHLHRQVGVATNGAEIHPILRFEIDAAALGCPPAGLEAP